MATKPKNPKNNISSENVSDIGEGCVQSTVYNMITQVSLRLTTFLLNSFILHRVDREVLGLINIRLTLLADTIIFVSREAFRLACQGHTSDLKGWAGVLNLVWCGVPVSILSCGLLSWIWLNLLPSPSNNLLDDYESAVYLVAVSMIIQMMAEAPCLVATVYQFIRLRVILEFVLMAVKLIVLVYAVVYMPGQIVKVWAYGALLSSLIYSSGFYLCFYLIFRFHPQSQTCSHKSSFPFTGVSQLLPTLVDGRLQIHQKYKEVAQSFLGQGLLKQLLTEGEKYLMTFFNLLSLSQQGTYDVISNLGSLACRFLFRPIEENSYLFFSQQWERGKDWELQDKDNRENVRIGLFRLLRITFLIGLLTLTFGFSYSDLLLTLYGGHRLASDGGTILLRAQCLLVACFAVNGVTECFARTVMTDLQINRFNIQLVYLSTVYLALSWVLTKVMGPVGLVLSNAANISIRIFISVQIINKTFQNSKVKNPMFGLLPDNDILFLLLSSATCVQLSELYLYFWHPIVHLTIGIILFVMVVLAIILKEDFIISFVLTYMHRLGYYKIKRE